jgi:hypothetical protein
MGRVLTSNLLRPGGRRDGGRTGGVLGAAAARKNWWISSADRNAAMLIPFARCFLLLRGGWPIERLLPLASDFYFDSFCNSFSPSFFKLVFFI